MRRELAAALALGLAGLWIVGCGMAERAQRSALAEPYLTAPADIGPIEPAAGGKLAVLATTSVLADVVAQVGGTHIELHTLIPAGVDPHAFQPGPQDVRALADADLVIINGFSLEEFMADLITQAGEGTPVVSASLGIDPLLPSGEYAHEDEAGEHAGEADGPAEDEHEGESGEQAGETEAHSGEDEHAAEHHEHGIDPHTWFDPNNVIHWTANIEAALAAADPQHAQEYAANADAYRAQLQALDAEIRQEVERIPPEQRRLVTDHEELGYFADEYGFEIVGAVIPSASSLAEPSAQEMAALFDAIRKQGVRAIFVTSVANPGLAERLAEDAGVRLVTLYGHSLTDEQGPAPSYLEMMRYNLQAITDGLAP